MNVSLEELDAYLFEELMWCRSSYGLTTEQLVSDAASSLALPWDGSAGRGAWAWNGSCSTFRLIASRLRVLQARHPEIQRLRVVPVGTHSYGYGHDPYGLWTME